MTKGIIILGMFRSGTSLLANLVREWGAYLGENDKFSEADQWNEHGYWEYHPLRKFNRELLTSVNAGQRVPPDDRGKALLRERAEDPHYRERARALIEGMRQGGGGRPWAWKDPQFLSLLPFWSAIWQDVSYVIALRHPLDIAQSAAQMIPRAFNVAVERPAGADEQSQGGIFSNLVEQSLGGKRVQPAELPVANMLLFWQRLMLEALSFTDQNPHKIFIGFEQLIQAPDLHCTRLYDFLQAENPEFGQNGQRLEAMRQMIKPDLRHVEPAKPLSEVYQATSEQRALFNLLQQKIADPDAPFDAARYPLHPGWREFIETGNELFETKLLIKGWRD